MCSARCPRCAGSQLSHESGEHYCFICEDVTAGYDLPGYDKMGKVKQSGPYKETMLNGLSKSSKKIRENGEYWVSKDTATGWYIVSYLMYDMHYALPGEYVKKWQAQQAADDRNVAKSRGRIDSLHKSSKKRRSPRKSRK